MGTVDVSNGIDQCLIKVKKTKPLQRSTSPSSVTAAARATSVQQDCTPRLHRNKTEAQGHSIVPNATQRRGPGHTSVIDIVFCFLPSNEIGFAALSFDRFIEHHFTTPQHRHSKMIVRFCLYGLLKNQRYFDAFKTLSWLSKGLSFAQIGIMQGFSSLIVNLLEVPTGVIADVTSRRWSLVIGFWAYIISFIGFGLFSNFYIMLGCMFFYALGDALRSGSHKSLIFTHLEINNIVEKKTKVYGTTRSLAKIGSAISSIIAPIIVIWSGNLDVIWYFSVIPYILNSINILSYPKELDGERKKKNSSLWAALKEAFGIMFKRKPLRRLMFESVAMGNPWSILKDYVQPIVEAMALGLSLDWDVKEFERTAILIGIVYFFLSLIEAFGSKGSARVVKMCGGEPEKAITVIWFVQVGIFAAMTFFLFIDFQLGFVFVYILLSYVFNSFRPIHLSRFDSFVPSDLGATALSIENQTKSLTMMFVAPSIGYIVDQSDSFLSVGILGLTFGLLILFTVPFYIKVLYVPLELRKKKKKKKKKGPKDDPNMEMVVVEPVVPAAVSDVEVEVAVAEVEVIPEIVEPEIAEIETEITEPIEHSSETEIIEEIVVEEIEDESEFGELEDGKAYVDPPSDYVDCECVVVEVDDDVFDEDEYGEFDEE
ncbi:hypothetical protein PCE1_002691 [Barthelona sp. PCE]